MALTLEDIIKMMRERDEQIDMTTISKLYKLYNFTKQTRGEEFARKEHDRLINSDEFKNRLIRQQQRIAFEPIRQQLINEEMKTYRASITPTK